MAMGALGLAMVGMTALAPVLAHLLGPVIIPLYEMLGANPSMFAGTLLACDMGGFFLAKELAGGDVAAWMYSGLITRLHDGADHCVLHSGGARHYRTLPIAAGWRSACWRALSLFLSAVSPAVWWRCIPGGDQRPAGSVYLRADPDEYDPGDHRRRAGGAGAEVHSGKNDQAASRSSPNSSWR